MFLFRSLSYTLTHTFYLFIFDYINLLKVFLNKWIEHAYHEANKCEDAFAEFGSFLFYSFVTLDEPLLMVENFLTFDKAKLLGNLDYGW